MRWLTAFVGKSRDERTITMQQASGRVIAEAVGVKPGEEDMSRYVRRQGAPEGPAGRGPR